MKKHRFPLHLALFGRHFLPSEKVRAALVLALIALVSSLPFYTFAQNDTVSAKKSRIYSVDPDRGAFVMYAGPDGEAVCREATQDEARAIRNGTSNGLRQINHLETETSSPSGNGATSATGLTIILRATAQLDANPTAKQAFVAAAAKWETLIKDPITIAIDVDYGTTFFGTPFSDANVLGATSSPQFFFAGNYPDVRSRLNNHATAGSPEAALAAALPAAAVPTDIGSVNTVFVGSPLLRALGAFPADFNNDTQSLPAPKIAFNSAFGFDFDPSDGITGNRTDFDAVAVHEMGHALGFNSEVGDRELDASAPLAVTIWDIFRFRPATANLGNFSTAQRILSSGGTQVQFNGGAELGLSTGRPNGTGGDLNQAGHWKDDQNIDANFIGIMDPNIRRNHREVMTANDQSAIDSFGYSTTPTTPPPNDNFANAQTVIGSSGTVNGNNIFGTRETGEPTNPPGTGGGRSIWYNWTAPGTGQATFDTIGSNYDTILAVYQGSSVNALTHLASNDDISPLSDPPPRNIQSRVIFSVTAGQLYRIQVDGFDGAEGSVVLNWTAPGAATPTPTPTPTPAGPNTVQFSVSTANATETANATTHLDLQVTRTGDTSQAATVNYATSDVSASERSDYQATLGTLHFGANETLKTIPVFIVNDAFGEPAETFNIALSGPVGCTLGSTPSMVITINSDEAVNGLNPVKDASFNTDFFVRQHYVDFFNREADVGGLAFWKNQIDECTTQACREIRRINVSAAFFKSIEFQETGYLVERLYKTAYGNATGNSTLGGTHTLPVPIVRLNEFLPDTQQIGRGVVIGQPGADQLLENNKQALIAEFVQRPRFLTAYPVSMTPAQFVDTLNTNAGGVLSTAERNQLVSDLTTATKTRAQVLRAVAEDSDLFAAETNRAFVLAQFFGYLRRNPNDSPDADYTGYDFWLGKLNEFNGNFVNAEMVKAFIVSGEYQGRFGP